jgi:hypothetical protein
MKKEYDDDVIEEWKRHTETEENVNARYEGILRHTYIIWLSHILKQLKVT